MFLEDLSPKNLCLFFYLRVVDILIIKDIIESCIFWKQRKSKFLKLESHKI